MIIDTTVNAQPTKRMILDYDIRIRKIHSGTSLLTRYGINRGYEGSWHLTVAKGDFYEERYPFGSEAEAWKRVLDFIRRA